MACSGVSRFSSRDILSKNEGKTPPILYDISYLTQSLVFYIKSIFVHLLQASETFQIVITQRRAGFFFFERSVLVSELMG